MIIAYPLSYNDKFNTLYNELIAPNDAKNRTVQDLKVGWPRAKHHDK